MSFASVLLGFLFLAGSLSYSQRRTWAVGIVLVPIGEVNQKVIEDLSIGLEKTFRARVEIQKAMPHPGYAYNKKRNQYLSTAILKALIEEKEYLSSYSKVLGVVDLDLYVPELNFVFGEATERAAVISLTRLRQEFYRLPGDDRLFRKRVLTEAVHELGHTFGLGHCRNPRCVMFFSNSLIDTDRKGSEFCQECIGRLPGGDR